MPKEKELIQEAMKAYGIDEKYVMDAKQRGDEVTIVTAGGHKVKWKPGDRIEKLPASRITGDKNVS